MTSPPISNRPTVRPPHPPNLARAARLRREPRRPQAQRRRRGRILVRTSRRAPTSKAAIAHRRLQEAMGESQSAPARLPRPRIRPPLVRTAASSLHLGRLKQRPRPVQGTSNLLLKASRHLAPNRTLLRVRPRPRHLSRRAVRRSLRTCQGYPPIPNAPTI